MSDHLKKTEKKLVTLFVTGIILFLVLFEGIFLASRYFLERDAHEEEFLMDTEHILGNMTRLTQGIRPLGIGIILIDYRGEILFSQMPGVESSGNIADFIDMEVLDRLSPSISYMDGNMIRRVDAEEYTVLFFGADYKGYEIFMRDMWRFVIFDILLLIPIWFLIGMYIRRVLRPVQENLDTMTHFVHDAGHELKTPLAIISGNLQIMRDSIRTDYDLVEESLSTIDAMNESIQGLLELADLKMPQQSEKTHLHDLVAQEVKRANNHKNVTIQTDIPERAIIAASEKHLSILIRNLLENAIKYNKEGGSVFLSFKKNTFKIRDTGIGMEAADTVRIFDRFYRINKNSDQRGSWIGLTLVDRIVKLYDWNIVVESVPGEGTTISVTF